MSSYGSTYHLADVTQAIQDVLIAAAPGLGIASNGDGSYDVYYGDQTMIPRNPCICIEPAPMTRRLQGASNPPRMQNEFTVLIMVYIQEINSIEQIALDRDLLLDKVQDVLHADWTLGGMLVFGACTDIDPGYAIRQGRLLRCGKITYTGMNKTFLIDNANVQ